VSRAALTLGALMLAACGARGPVLLAPEFSAGENAVSVRLSFDGKASAQLIQHGGKLEVVADWYGAPSDKARETLPPDARDVVLARQVQMVDPVGQTLVLRGEALPDRRMDAPADGLVRVRVAFRVIGAQEGTPEIGCGALDDRVSALKSIPPEALCGFTEQPKQESDG